MSRRGVALLLIGIGAGIIGVAVIVLAYLVVASQLFGIGVRFRPASLLLAVPFLLILVGWFLLRKDRRAGEL